MDNGGHDVTGAAGVVTVPDDRPLRARQRRLRRPAAWSLGLGAASLVPLSWGAFRPESERLVSWGTLTSGASIDVARILFFVSGCLACLWLVRLQWLLARAGRVRSVATDGGIWIMWAIPILQWILPAWRISQWDKAIHGRRSLTVLAWALAWLPCSAFILGSSGDRTAVPDAGEGWLHVGVFVATFALWAASVVHLTRGAEVVSHASGIDA